MRKPDVDSHYDEAWANAEPPLKEGIERALRDSELVSGVCGIIRGICKADKDERLRRLKVGFFVRFLLSCLIDADHTNTADFSKPTAATLRQHGQYVGWRPLADRLERELGRFSADRPVDELRKRVSEQCLAAATRPRGIYTLTVPTGGGKTLGSLRFALNHAAKWEMERIIYISPHTSIIDQNAEVVRKILEPAGSEFASVVLEHHSNLTPLEQTSRSKVLSENWDALVVFTTAVQFLEALFGAGTRSARRMHQTAKAVLSFDEIQTLPVAKVT
jgi:CRISPR-associated endonuclease/helicase Cas3